MRILTLLLLLTACSKKPVAPVSVWTAFKGGTEVMDFRNSPGILGSRAIRPPIGTPIEVHPFLTISSREPGEEHAIRQLIEESADFSDFENKLRTKGYTIKAAQYESIHGVDSITAFRNKKAVVTFEKGRDNTTAKLPPFSHRLLNKESANEVREIMSASKSFDDFAFRLGKAGYVLRVPAES